MKSHHGNRHGFHGTRNFKFSDPLQILHTYSRCRHHGSQISQIKADNKHLFLFAKLLANKRMKQSNLTPRSKCTFAHKHDPGLLPPGCSKTSRSNREMRKQFQIRNLSHTHTLLLYIRLSYLIVAVLLRLPAVAIGCGAFIQLFVILIVVEFVTVFFIVFRIQARDCFPMHIVVR